MEFPEGAGPDEREAWAAAMLRVLDWRIAGERERFLAHTSAFARREARWRNAASRLTDEYRSLCAAQAALEAQQMTTPAADGGADALSAMANELGEVERVQATDEAVGHWERVMRAAEALVAKGPVIEAASGTATHPHAIDGAALSAAMGGGEREVVDLVAVVEGWGAALQRAGERIKRVHAVGGAAQGEGGVAMQTHPPALAACAATHAPRAAAAAELITALEAQERRLAASIRAMRAEVAAAETSAAAEDAAAAGAWEAMPPRTPLALLPRTPPLRVPLVPHTPLSRSAAGTVATTPGTAAARKVKGKTSTSTPTTTTGTTTTLPTAGGGTRSHTPPASPTRPLSSS